MHDPPVMCWILFMILLPHTSIAFTRSASHIQSHMAVIAPTGHHATSQAIVFLA